MLSSFLGRSGKVGMAVATYTQRDETTPQVL